MASRPLPELLGVEQVMSRYGLRDRRVARRVMDEAGAFMVGRRLVVRLDDLDAYERRLRTARQGGDSAPPQASGHRRRPRLSIEIRPGWWREAGGEG